MQGGLFIRRGVLCSEVLYRRVEVLPPIFARELSRNENHPPILPPQSHRECFWSPTLTHLNEFPQPG